VNSDRERFPCAKLIIRSCDKLAGIKKRIDCFHVKRIETPDAGVRALEMSASLSSRLITRWRASHWQQIATSQYLRQLLQTQRKWCRALILLRQNAQSVSLRQTFISSAVFQHPVDGWATQVARSGC